MAGGEPAFVFVVLFGLAVVAAVAAAGRRLGPRRLRVGRPPSSVRGLHWLRLVAKGRGILLSILQWI